MEGDFGAAARVDTPAAWDSGAFELDLASEAPGRGTGGGAASLTTGSRAMLTLDAARGGLVGDAGAEVIRGFSRRASVDRSLPARPIIHPNSKDNPITVVSSVQLIVKVKAFRALGRVLDAVAGTAGTG